MEILKDDTKQIANYIMEEINRRMDNKIPTPFRFVYNDSEEFNASVYFEDGIQYMEFNVGIIKEIEEVYIKLINNLDFYKDIIGCKIHTEEDIETMYLFLKIFSKSHILAHEIGHHINGHLLYLNNACNMKKLNMFDNEISPDTLLRKTIEWDADAFSTTYTIQDIFGLCNSRGNNKSSGLLSKLYKIAVDNETLFKMWLHTSQVVFNILGANNGIIGKINESNYLATSVRQLASYEVAGKVIKELGRNYIEFKRFRELSILIPLKTDEIYKQYVAEWREVREVIEEVIISGAMNELDMVATYWDNKLRCELQPYARVKFID